MSIKGSPILLRLEESCQAARRTYSGIQAEGYKLSRKARTKPFKTFSVSTTLGSSRDEFSLGKKPNP
jgi:hypothetical protein